MKYPVAYYENRINILRHRPKDNENIIRKLKRQIRNLQKES